MRARLLAFVWRYTAKENLASDEPVVLVRCQAGDGLLDDADVDVLPQPALQAGEVVMDSYTRATSWRMNCRTGWEVKYR